MSNTDNEIKKEPGTMGGIRYRHPAMAMVSFTRCQGSKNLFGSSIEQQHFIQLRIKTASVERELSNDWYHSDCRDLIEVSLTPNQFAELLTSMNVGDGVPCTLNEFNGEHFSFPKMESKGSQFKREIRDAVKKTVGHMTTAVKDLENLLDRAKPLTKAEKAEVIDKIHSLHKLTEDSLPFILNQFQEQMDKSVVEAKAAVDTFITHTITKTGLTTLKDQGIKFIEQEDDNA